MFYFSILSCLVSLVGCVWTLEDGDVAMAVAMDSDCSFNFVGEFAKLFRNEPCVSLVDGGFRDSVLYSNR
jgi:hypothetical protein